MSSSDPSPAVEQEYSESLPGAPIEAVLCRTELATRSCRPPDDQRFNAATRLLLQGFTSRPQTVLQSLTDTIAHVLQCDSAGISLINPERTRFYWPSITGVWRQHIGGGTPLHFGPCGDVLNAGASLHMREIHKRYTYFTPVAWVKEVLLAPFWVDGKMTGTIWAVIHEPPDDIHSRARMPREYDREDMRILESLADLAAQAYQIWSRHNARA